MWVIWNKERRRPVMRADGKTVWKFGSESDAQKALDRLATMLNDQRFVDRVYEVREEKKFYAR